MGVIFRGGSSGNRQDALPPVPSSGTAQPLRDTSGGSSGTNLQTCQNSANGRSPGDPGLTSPPVPEGCAPSDLIASGSSDECQQDIKGLGPNSGNQSVFKGAPNTGHE